SPFAVAAGISLVFLALVSGIVALSFARTGPRPHTPNPEAVRLYDVGRWHHQKLTDESLHKAIDFLNRAIQIDPEYVPPYSALFGIYTWGVQGISDEEKLQNIKQIAKRLLRLDPKLAEGHAALSYSKYLQGDWRGAEEEMQLALRLNPNYAQAHGTYCYYLSLLGRVEEAKMHGRRAHELDP